MARIVVSGSERFASSGIFCDLLDQAIKLSHGKAYASLNPPVHSLVLLPMAAIARAPLVKLLGSTRTSLIL